MNEGYSNIFVYFAPYYMAMKILYQYLKWDRQSSLRNISQSTIDAINKEMKIIASFQSDDITKMEGKYIKLGANDQATIGEYAVKNGITVAIHHFRLNKGFPNFKEASVRGWNMHISRKYKSNSVEDMGQLRLKSCLRNVKEGFYLEKNGDWGEIIYKSCM